MRRRVLALTPLLALPLAVAWADHPPGAILSGALLVDLTASGFEQISEIARVAVPPTIDIPDIPYSDKIDFWVGKAYIEALVSNLRVDIAIDGLDLEPSTGQIDLTMTAQLNLNDAADMMNFWVDVYVDSWPWDFDLGTIADCDGYIDLFTIDATSSVGITVIDDGINPTRIDATVAPIAWDWDLEGSDIYLRNCTLGDVDEWFDDIFGVSPIDLLFDLLLPVLKDQVDAQLQDLRPTIEETIESALGAASFHDKVPLGATELAIDVQPERVEITPDGVRVTAEGGFSAAPHPCVAEYGHTESLETASAAPALADAPSPITGHHLGIIADDDFVNQGMFALYSGGALCYTLTEGDGLPINSTLLTLLDRDAYTPLFPSQVPLIVQTRPAEVPQVVADGASDVNLTVEKLGVDFYAELDHRMALVLGADLDVETGANLAFDRTTGALGVEVGLDAEDITTTIRHNEFAPGDDEKIAGAFGGLFDVVVAPVLSGALGDLTFPLPAMAFDGRNFGLARLDVAASGPSRDRIGAYGWVDEVPYAAGSGCSGGGGCGGGCTMNGVPLQGLLLAAPVLVGLIRRRR